MEERATAPGGVAVVVRSLRHVYRGGAGEVTVLDGVDLDIPAGGHAAVVGPSGSGKSTLLSVLGGLERLQGGSASVGDTDLARLRGGALARYRQEMVGFVFQHFGLLESLTAAENVELAGTLQGGARRERRRRAAELLDAVGLGHRCGHRPLQLSGGERQRVAIARAMANRPRLLLADEPTGNLDHDSAACVVELLEGMQAGAGCTLVVVTHDRDLAARAPIQIRLEAENRP